MDENIGNNTQEGTQPNTETEAVEMKLEVSIRHITPVNNLLAFANVKINDSFVVDGIKILTGENGMFINMPSMPDGKGGYKDVCFPVTAEFRQQLINAVINEFSQSIENLQETVNKLREIKDAPKKEPLMGRLEAAEKVVKAKGELPPTGLPPATQKNGEASLC